MTGLVAYVRLTQPDKPTLFAPPSNGFVWPLNGSPGEMVVRIQIPNHCNPHAVVEEVTQLLESIGIACESE